MDILKTNPHNNSNQKDFWDSLQTELLTSNQNLTRDDIIYFIEKNYMFSLFFRGSSYKEISCFKSLFQTKEHGYLILLELLSEDKPNFLDYDVDEYEFYRFLKAAIGPDISNTIGPIISNRINVLVSLDSKQTGSITSDSTDLAQKLVDSIRRDYQVPASAGIGNVHTIQSIYPSFLEALSCMHRCHPGQVIHVQNLEAVEQDYHYDYIEAERHMLEAVRLHKVEAYDYFVLMMNHLQPLNDDMKRNKIAEALVLASHNVQMDGQDKVDFFNYTAQISKLMELTGNELIEWAYQKFIYITGFVKPQISIDYSNKIVQATKDYLETHYSEEISLENVAEQVNISPQYFSKLIKKNTGFNFIDWLSMLRVKKAKELLSNSNYTVKEVCFMVGYKDPNYFSRIFKKRIGITPSEYVKNRTYISSNN